MIFLIFAGEGFWRICAAPSFRVIIYTLYTAHRQNLLGSLAHYSSLRVCLVGQQIASNRACNLYNEKIFLPCLCNIIAITKQRGLAFRIILLIFCLAYGHRRLADLRTILQKAHRLSLKHGVRFIQGRINPPEGTSPPEADKFVFPTLMA